MLQVGDRVRMREVDGWHRRLGPDDFIGIVVMQNGHTEFRIIFQYHKDIQHSGGRSCYENEVIKLEPLTVEEMLTHWHEEVRKLTYVTNRG